MIRSFILDIDCSADENCTSKIISNLESHLGLKLQKEKDSVQDASFEIIHEANFHIVRVIFFDNEKTPSVETMRSILFDAQTKEISDIPIEKRSLWDRFRGMFSP